jgi:hypothetical protein
MLSFGVFRYLIFELDIIRIVTKRLEKRLCDMAYAP